MILKNKKWIFLILVSLFLGLIFYFYNDKPDSLKNKKADFEMHANELMVAFQENENHALEKYKNKIVLLEGIIKDVLPVNDSIANLLLETGEDGLNTIKCGISKSAVFKVKSLQVGKAIKLKCICNGFNKMEDFGLEMYDIEMNGCVFEN